MDGVSLLWQAGAVLISAGAVYGGIRKDLQNMHERQNKLEQAIETERKRINDCTAYYGRRALGK